MSIVKNEGICPEHPWNLAMTSLKSVQNILEISLEHLGDSQKFQVPDEVPSSLRTFPRVSQVLEAPEWCLRFLHKGSDPHAI